MEISKEFNRNGTFIAHTVHNLSSHQLTEEERLALSCGLDQHIPSKLNKNDVQTEFKILYQDVLRCIPMLSEDEKTTLKTKLTQLRGRFKMLYVR